MSAEITPQEQKLVLEDSIPKSLPESSFREVIEMIQQTRQHAFQMVNAALIDLYWRVGEYISRKVESSAWGEGVVDQLAAYINQEHPEIKGFTRRNLFRMRQFFETYYLDEKVTPLVRQLPLDT